MKFYEYLEAKYVETNLKLQVGYTPYKQSETRAVQSIIDGQRTFFKWVAYIKLIFEFALMSAHLIKAPKSPKQIGEEMRAQAEAEDKAKQETTLQLVPEAPPPTS